ncbi:hypothetical protein EmuJ_000934500 [Echinococcus multilocularis]|uniref:Uncharacterized protein n=1 Tax=Echinococcus multilocularis TaxID=6211 RepID=A0A068YED2_ECHMU|nr:hypothetical protein EmuJ_000934500 [Echinococcus multilocularis]
MVTGRARHVFEAFWLFAYIIRGGVYDRTSLLSLTGVAEGEKAQKRLANQCGMPIPSLFLLHTKKGKSKDEEINVEPVTCPYRHVGTPLTVLMKELPHSSWNLPFH